jgi:cytochrome c peroxidase
MKGAKAMKGRFLVVACCFFVAGAALAGDLGLPPVPVPADNPQTPEKIALGDKLFNDTRFSTTGEVSCATCHDAAKAMTDSPLVTSAGINGLTGTRNAPTVLNAAFNRTQFWDGRSPSLEDQSQHPFINPVEMGLPNHEPILEIVNSDPDYGRLHRSIWHCCRQATRTTSPGPLVLRAPSGRSPWDRWYFGGEQDAISEAAQRGFQLFRQRAVHQPP